MDTSDTGTSTSSRARGRRGAATPAALKQPASSSSGRATRWSARSASRATSASRAGSRVRSPRPVRSPCIRAAPSARRSPRATSSSTGASKATLSREELLALGETASFAGEVRAGTAARGRGCHRQRDDLDDPAGDAPPARRMDEHEDEATVDVTGSPVRRGRPRSLLSENAGSESECVQRRACRGDVRRLLGFGLRRGLSRGLVAKPPGGEGECAVKRVVTFAQAVHGAVELLFEGARGRRGSAAPIIACGQGPDHSIISVHSCTSCGTHTDQQLGDADVGESRHLEHVGEHPRLAEQRVMRGRACADGWRGARAARRTRPAQAWTGCGTGRRRRSGRRGLSTRRISANACHGSSRYASDCPSIATSNIASLKTRWCASITV